MNRINLEIGAARSAVLEDDRAQTSANVRAIAPPIGVDRFESGFASWLNYGLAEIIASLAALEGEKIAGCERPACSALDEANARNLALSLVYVCPAAKGKARCLLGPYWPALEAVFCSRPSRAAR